jgi:hypothetical protein
MNQYTVVFDLFTYEGTARITESTNQNLVTQVLATNPYQAERMVVAQYGGDEHVWVKTVHL